MSAFFQQMLFDAFTVCNCSSLNSFALESSIPMLELNCLHTHEGFTGNNTYM